MENYVMSECWQPDLLPNLMWCVLHPQTRQVAGSTFLEACVENNSKAPMSLEYVRFDAAPHLTAHNIDVRDAALSDFTSEGPLHGYIDQLQVKASVPEASCLSLRVSARVGCDSHAALRHTFSLSQIYR